MTQYTLPAEQWERVLIGYLTIFVSGGCRILKRGVPACNLSVRLGCLLRENFGFLAFSDRFWCILGVKLQKLDDLLLNLVVALEARRIKGVTPLQAAEAAKQLVICVNA